MWSRALICALAVAACGDDGDATPERVEGSPAATRALAFLASGEPVAIGGTSTFGLAKLGRKRGNAWLDAGDVPPFGARAQLFGGGARTLYALSETQLYRLDDPAAFTWSMRVVPPAASALTVIGVDDADLVYAFELAVDGTGAVLTWAPGTQIWNEVPGSRPIGLGARAFVVEPGGRVTWSDPARGIVRVEAGAQATIVECAAEELGACTVPLTGVAYGANGALGFVVCPAAFRLRGDELATFAVPDEPGVCGDMTTTADGTSLLAAQPDAETEGALLRLGPTSKSWSREAAAQPGFTYVLRDHSTAFAFGDGLIGRGIFELGL